MDTNRFTDRAQEVLLGAQQAAEQRQHGQVDVEHLLVTLLEQQDSIPRTIIIRLDADPALVQRDLEEALSGAATIYGAATQITMAPRLRQRDPGRA